MTFQELQDAVIVTRFNESQREQVKQWLNLTYAKIWTAEPWTFKQAEGQVSVSVGSTALGSMPTDFLRANGLWNALGERLAYVTPNDWNDAYSGDASTGTPAHYTVVNKTIKVGPPSSESSSAYTLLYERNMVPMTAQDTVPVLPEEFHYLLVQGAMATGLVSENDFTFEFSQRLYAEGIVAMKQTYLANWGESPQFGRDRLAVS